MNPSSFVNLYVFPIGRRLHVHTAVHALARTMGLERIAAHVERAIAHDRETYQQELILDAMPTTQFGRHAVELNRAMDKVISGFERHLALQARVHGAGTPAADAAHTIRTQILPSGARAITHLPFIHQYRSVDAIIARLAEPDMQEALARVPGADTMVARMAELNAEYGRALIPEQSGVTREDVRVANARGQDLLAQTVILIFAEFVGNEGDARFLQLMQPVVEQNTAIGERYRRRRSQAASRKKAEKVQEEP